MMPNLSKLCRACLNVIDSFKYNLFEDISPDIYWFCTNIKVAKDEKLPKSLCTTCYDLITKFSEFKKVCLQSQNTLLNYCSDVSDTKKDWSTNDIAVADAQRVVLNKLEGKFESVTVKDEDFDSNYDDLEPAELPFELDVKVKKNKSHRKVRVKTLNRRKKLKCELCTKSFISQEKLELHNLSHQEKKSLKCTICNKTFMTQSGLKRHHSSWHVRVNLSSLKCHTCGKIAKSRESLRVHEKLHRKRNLFICNVCGQGSTTSAVLKTHLETHRENRERHCTCEHCGKKFYTNKILMSHVQRCHTGKRYICHICSYPFTDKYNLAKHLSNHEGKSRAFKCEVCHKSYTSRSSYVEHQRTHSGERPYMCNFCAKSFISARRLTEHARTHTGERPHKCSVCDHSFAQRGTLTRHMKVHDRIVTVVN